MTPSQQIALLREALTKLNNVVVAKNRAGTDWGAQFADMMDALASTSTALAATGCQPTIKDSLQVDLQELRRKAEAAKQFGKWFYATDRLMLETASSEREALIAEDREYIAAASPDVILALIDRLVEAEERAHQWKALSEMQKEALDTSTEINRLKEEFGLEAKSCALQEDGAPDFDDRPDAYMYKTGVPWGITFSDAECKNEARIVPVWFVSKEWKSKHAITSIPDGFVLVPKEPTAEMLRSAALASLGIFLNGGPPANHREPCSVEIDAAKSAYRAAIEAALPVAGKEKKE